MIHIFSAGRTGRDTSEVVQEVLADLKKGRKGVKLNFCEFHIFYQKKILKLIFSIFFVWEVTKRVEKKFKISSLTEAHFLFFDCFAFSSVNFVFFTLLYCT